MEKSVSLVERLRLQAEDLHILNPSSETVKCLSLGADRIEALEKERDGLRTEIGSMVSLGQRLALELQCVLLDCKDMAIVSKWDGPAHEALQAWEDFCRSVTHGDENEPC